MSGNPCRKHHVAIERSRSGDGAHVWVFFDEAVPSATARSLGSSLRARPWPPGPSSASTSASDAGDAGDAEGNFRNGATIEPAAILSAPLGYPCWVTKRLIEVDDDKLEAVRSLLGTRTLKATVDDAFNEVLALAQRRRALLAEHGIEPDELADPAARRDAWG